MVDVAAGAPPPVDPVPTQSTAVFSNEGDRRIAYAHTASDQRTVQGAFTIGSYVVVWLAASVCPFALIGFLCLGWWLTAAGLVAALAFCSLPVTPKASIKAFYRTGSTCYFTSASLLYENHSALAKAGNALPPTVYAMHPHGVFSMGWATLFTQPELADVRWCFAHILYRAPFFKAFVSMMGYPASADKGHFLKLLKRKLNIALLPGGFEEATISSAAADRVYIAKRKGWVKYALQHGYSITPVYNFGERECYANLQFMMPLRLWLSTKGIPGVLPFGRWFCPILPRDTRLHIVVGTPLAPPTGISNPPTDAEVSAHHAKYVDALKGLFDRYKVEYYGLAAKDAALEIW